MPKATITKINPWSSGKGAVVVMEAAGHTKEYCSWASAPFYSQLTVGAEIEFTSEERENQNNPGKKQSWFTSVNGVAEKSKKQGGWNGGGGGGRQTDEESIAAQVILKETSALTNAEILRSKAEKFDPARLVEISLALTQAYLCAYYEIKKGKDGKA